VDERILDLRRALRRDTALTYGMGDAVADFMADSADLAAL
jgi:hypothetical protein